LPCICGGEKREKVKKETRRPFQKIRVEPKGEAKGFPPNQGKICIACIAMFRRVFSVLSRIKFTYRNHCSTSNAIHNPFGS